MQTLKNVLGHIWAAPVTLCGLIYVGVFTALRWYRFHARYGNGLFFVLNEDKAPNFLKRAWTGWAGHTVGAVIVLVRAPDDMSASKLIAHELCHTRQAMTLGVFQVVCYVLAMLFIKLGCPTLHHYRDNPFELDARRGAGQE